jgi:hypothetical protein
MPFDMTGDGSRAGLGGVRIQGISIVFASPSDAKAISMLHGNALNLVQHFSQVVLIRQLDTYGLLHDSFDLSRRDPRN